MKKLFCYLLNCLMIILSIVNISMAQTSIFSEGFDSGNLPANWTRSQQPNSVGWVFGNNLGSSQYFNIPAHGNYAASNDDANDDNTFTKNDASLDYLISPAIDLTPYSSTSVALTFAAFFSNDYGSIGTVEVSTNGGTSWSILHTMSPTATWETVSVNLSPYTSSSTVQIAFHHDDDGGWADGFAIDDVEVFVPVENEVVLTGLNVDDFVTVNHSTPTIVDIMGTIQNKGSEPLTSIDVKWQANGGTVYTQNFTGLNIGYGFSYNFFHPYQLTINEPESFDINVWIENPNGNTDGNNADNQLSARVSGLGGMVTKNVLIEEFSGAWCQFCPDGTYRLDQILINNPNAIAVTIHDGDAMEIGAGAQLVTQYISTPQGRSGFPSGMVDRVDFGDDIAHSRVDWTPNFLTRSMKIVPVSVDVSNTYDSLTRQITIDVSSIFWGEASGNFRINAYVVEDSVVGTGSGYNQINYYHNVSGHPYSGAGNPIIGFAHNQVLRAALGGAWGVAGTIPGDVAFQDTFSRQFTYTLPPTMGGVPVKDKDIKVIAFVQLYDLLDDKQRHILNAVETRLNDSASTAVTITYDPMVSTREEIALDDEIFQVYPNPAANDIISLNFNKPATGDMKLQFFDMAGKLLYKEERNLNGQNLIQLNTGKLPLGTYLIAIELNERKAVKRFVKIN